MSETKAIAVQNKPNLISRPEVNLRKSDFEVLIQQKGYDVWHDHAVKCPCSSKDGGSNQSSCKNCGGAGWLYINRTLTRMVIQSMNVTTKLKEWSEERTGTANITARDVDRLSFMDRVTLLDSESEHSQVVFLHKQPDTDFLYGTTRYDIVEEYSVFLFDTVSTPLIKLEKGVDYTVDRNQIKLLAIEDGDIENPSISIRYTHRAEYTVLDLPRDVMVSTIKDECDNTLKDVQFPLSAVARKTHYMLDRHDYENDNLIDNSF